jgi:hypothetical protein
MSQFEVLTILERHKTPLSCREIALEINCNPIRVHRDLNKLLCHQEIKAIEISRDEAKEKFGDNAPPRRMRLYFV